MLAELNRRIVWVARLGEMEEILRRSDPTRGWLVFGHWRGAWHVTTT